MNVSSTDGMLISICVDLCLSVVACAGFVLRRERLPDFFPGVEGLPSGLTRDEFQSQYGGLGGKVTLRLGDKRLTLVEWCLTAVSFLAFHDADAHGAS